MRNQAGTDIQTEQILGICLGASTVSMVHLAAPLQNRPGSGPWIVAHETHVHEGHPKNTLLRALAGKDLAAFDKIVATGRKFRHHVNFTSISEPEAVEHAYAFLKPDHTACPAIVSAGGETFMVYVLDGGGRISNVITGNKCASGTGEFFLQQLRRMDVSLEEAAHWSGNGDYHHVSGRCSVFCKSDCTHATNKGVPKSKVAAGLCRMMANKILELLKQVKKENIMLCGGTAANRMMVDYLSAEIPGLIVPAQAPYFEALGAALWAVAAPETIRPVRENLFVPNAASFDLLPPISRSEKMVDFKTMTRGSICSGDIFTLGLDVGSTTTKAVLLKNIDNSVCADVYLRTNGDPVGAARNCYAAIKAQVEAATDPKNIRITGLGICGSGRQITGLHALTGGIINEIIAHATAAVFFDPQVDTILEIGGQDAKYTYIVNGVPADYAMNEACSAGTGSFLEESACETLGISTKDIANIALKASSPPNFNDQCAAFIASDIKNAIHEGAGHKDIVAGLVYSICMNYTNRVKGNRTVGQRIFMQGGVCYNKAVPLAMATLIGKPIVVPPAPGLMGAFGVALEVKNRIATGLMSEKDFDLKDLSLRDVTDKKGFVCNGGKTGCDRRCDIARIGVQGKTYPFGGACNRYYNLRNNIKYDVEGLDLVRLRQHLVFDKYAGKPHSRQKAFKGTVAINKSFMTNTYFPLYASFFTKLGYEVILSDTVSRKGVDSRGAAFCYPAELAHGFFHSLLTGDRKPDYLFLPYFRALPSEIENFPSQVCPIVQGEPFYLKAAFAAQIKALKKRGTRMLVPLIDLSKNEDDIRKTFVDLARSMGIGPTAAAAAYHEATLRQDRCFAEMKAMGRRALETLAQHPDQVATVIFARPYNGFVEEAHMGIPHKFASRGILTLPFDCLDYEDQPAKDHMYWGMGQRIMKAARLVEQHPQLFGTYITNFSCGPDSFLIGYFREIMGRKPSLTLELDSHTADAGVETRIEAFLDIVSAHRKVRKAPAFLKSGNLFRPAAVIAQNGMPAVRTSTGRQLPLNHDKVKILIPSMGKNNSESLAASLRGAGFHTLAHPPADEAILKLGRANTSCKECLPLILTTGTLLNYIQNHRLPGEALVYFMPTTSGPCRFGQYATFMQDLICRMEIPDVAVFSLSSENGYMGMGNGFEKKAWWGIALADVMEDVRAMLLANATDREDAMAVYETLWPNLLAALETGRPGRVIHTLAAVAEQLSQIPLKRPAAEVPVISLIGEIFVRRDDLSRQHITEYLADKGFAVRCAPIMEWIYYLDCLSLGNHNGHRMTAREKLVLLIKNRYKKYSESKIRKTAARSGLVPPHGVDINTIVEKGRQHISIDLGGEAILTVGAAISEIVHHACGVISIGPFGCMPTRLAEAILGEIMTRDAKLAAFPNDRKLSTTLSDVADLPFLSIESDGSPFPQVITAKLETFCLRSQRLHAQMQHNR